MHYFNVDPSTLRSPDGIHLIGAPKPSPFFAVLPLLCIMLNKPKNKKWVHGLEQRLGFSSILTYYE